MFIVDNTKKIQGEKILDIGTERSVNISFQFEDVQFNDEDNFTLILGQAYSFEYAFRNNGYLSFRRVDLSEIITKNSQNFAIKVYQGQDQILDDTLTVQAIVGDIDLSGYATKEDLQDYATNSYVSTNYYDKTAVDGKFNNKLSIYETTDSTDTIAVAYDASYKIVQIANTTANASLTINPCTGYTAESGKIPTFELWIIPTTKKTTISVSNSIQVVGDIPTELDADMAHCFTFRFVGSDQLLNYAYSFTPTAESSSSSESN